ncbi:hypothetical protein PUATCC27989T_00544 [Phytobacter ursingii]|nr:hypothetical protein PUATCC27989T_00544 [Phytobacter ursingii]
MGSLFLCIDKPRHGQANFLRNIVILIMRKRLTLSNAP